MKYNEIGKRKRILMLNYEFPPVGGGGGVAAKEFARGFIECGYEIDYLTSAYRDLEKYEKVVGINVYRVKVLNRKNLATASFFSMLSFLVFGFFKGVSLCHRNKYEFINTHFVLPTGPLGFLLGRIFRLKNILSIHGGDIYDPSLKRSPHRFRFFRIVINFLLNQADVVVAESTNTKNNAIKYYKPNNKIKIIPIPYRHFDFSKKFRMDLGLEADKKYLISVGRLVKRKGYKYLIKALDILGDKNVELILIGNGPEYKNLKILAEKLNIVNKVIFLNKLDNEKKFQYLNVSDIYVLSSLHEGFGIVLQEAMQVGLPIVATNNGGQNDIIKEGENGLLLEPKNSQKLSEKIKQLLDDEDLMAEMKSNNLKKVEEFETRRIAEKYLSLINGR